MRGSIGYLPKLCQLNYIFYNLIRVEEHLMWMKNSVSLFGHNGRENANMSNVEDSYNTIRRLNKGFVVMVNSDDL